MFCFFPAFRYETLQILQVFFFLFADLSWQYFVFSLPAVESSWIFYTKVDQKFGVLNLFDFIPDRCGATSATATRHLVNQIRMPRIKEFGG